MSKSWSCILGLLKKSEKQLLNEKINFYLWILFDWKKWWRKIYSQGGDGRSNFRYKSYLSQKKKQILYLSKKKQILSQKSYKSYLSNNILKNLHLKKICKFYLSKNYKSVSNKERNSISWKETSQEKKKDFSSHKTMNNYSSFHPVCPTCQLKCALDPERSWLVDQ